MIWWIDAGYGASGDMLLGALLDIDPEGLPAAQAAVDEVLGRLGAQSVRLGTQRVRRAGMAANQALVQCDDDATHRTWSAIEPALTGQPGAAAVFRILAEAEAHVHGVDVSEVHFHEVGALDAIADIVAVTTLWERLGPSEVVVSEVCVGSGSVGTEHGTMRVPVPAVAQLLRGAPTFAGEVAHEACTPTGAALLSTLADGWGPQPAMRVHDIGVGAGGRDVPGQPNILRILAGEPDHLREHLLVIETTIDDLDPRLYPDVMGAAKQAGALETWLTPVIMKHGRPATTLTALTPPAAGDAVAEVLFRQTNTLGVRFTRTDRWALARDVVVVEVGGHTIRVKRGLLRDEVLTAQPEYADALAAAQDTGLPVKEVIARAAAQARNSGQKKGSDATDGGDSDVRTLRN